MRVTLKIVGGFTGRAGAETYDVDVDQLPAADADRIRNLVHAARFAAQPATIKKPAPQSWDFLHELTVEDADGTHTVQFHPDAAPVELRDLGDAVKAIGKR